MTDQTTDKLPKNADAVGVQENADTNGVHPNLLAQSFPIEWKNVCLEMLLAFKESRRRKLGYKRLGWEHIRDLIMQDQDTYKAGELFERDARLRRQDLEALENGSEPTDVKFIFIDAFIRTLEMDEEAEDVRKSIILRQDQYHSSIYSDLYQSRSLDKSISDKIMSACPNFLFSEEVSDTWYKSIVFKICFEHKSIIKVIAAYFAR